jgi:16S rRNA pseudouridine516 synthase
MADRLDAFLAHRGFGTRSLVRVLVRSGAVTLDGVVVRDQAARVDGRLVRVDGVEVPVGPDSATMLLNKPLGYACSHDEREAPLIEELVPPAFAHLPLNSAGRLDRDTSGLLLVSTDGELIHALTNPRRHVLKRYQVRYAGKLSHHAVARVAKGIKLPDDPRLTLPARLELTGSDPAGLGLATLHLSEGRFHQVRRMFHELGGEVVALHRDRIGALEMPPDLTSGTMREITSEERALMLRDLDEEAPGSTRTPPPVPQAPVEPQLSMREILARTTTPPGARRARR